MGDFKKLLKEILLVKIVIIRSDLFGSQSDLKTCLNFRRARISVEVLLPQHVAAKNPFLLFRVKL